MKESTNEKQLVRLAVDQLKIDVPVMAWRVVGSRVELYLYGGKVAVWQGEDQPGLPARRSRTARKAKERMEK